MKWLLVNRWKSHKVSIDKLDNKKVRKRGKKTRLLDLLCTLKDKKGQMNVADNSGRSSDYLSSWELSSLHIPKPTSRHSSLESCYELVRYHSPLSKHLNSVANHPAGIASENVKPCDLPNMQSLICPTCRNVMLLLPQKRRIFAEECTSGLDNLRSAKRMRHSMNEHRISCSVNTREVFRHFNPTFEPTRVSTDNSIYSELIETVDSDSLVSINDRPILIGKRRPPNLHGNKEPVLNEWVVQSKDTDDVAEPTYATIPSDKIDKSLSGDLDFIGEPWMSSTLGRSIRLPADETVYDEVPLELDDCVSIYDWRYSLDSHYPNCTDVRRRMMDSPSNVNRKLKRMRREYFICEE